MATVAPKPTHVSIMFGTLDGEDCTAFYDFPLPQGPAGIDDVLRNVKKLLYQHSGLECPTCHR